MRRLVSVLVAALVLTGLAGPARADQATALYNGGTFQDILVDEAHGRVYVTDDDQIHSFNLAGAPAGNYYQLRDTRQMTMSPGDGAHVVLAHQEGLVLLDPLTLEPVRYVSLPGVTCPDAVAVASGLVFFSYGDCEGSTPGLGAIDLADGAMTTGLTTGAAPTDAQLVPVPGDPDALVASFGGTVSVLETAAGETPSTTVRASTDPISAVDVALTPDGGTVLVADGTSTQKAFAVADLTELPGRTVTGTTRAVAARADGMLAIGRRNVENWDLTFYAAGTGTPVRSIDFGLGRYPAPRGLVFGTKRAFLVTTNAAGENPSFHQVFAAAPAQVAITTDKKYYGIDTTATVAVRIVGGGATGIVNLYERQYGIQQRLVKRAALDPVTGKLVVKTKLRYNTTFTAVFEGDDEHGPGAAKKAVPVRTKLVLSSRHSSMAGPFHRVPKGTVGFVRGESHSPINHGCVKMVLSVRRADGTWRPIDAIPCLETTMSGTFSVYISGLRSGTRARITATYAGGARNAASLPTYYYLLFD